MWRRATYKVTSLLCRTAATVEQKKPLVYHEPRGRCLTESEEASERSFRESINDRGSASAFTVSQHFPVLRTVTRRHDYKSHAECWVCGPSGQPTQIYFASSDFDDASSASCLITSSHARRTTSPTRGRSSRLNADVERNSLPSLNVRVMLTLKKGTPLSVSLRNTLAVIPFSVMRLIGLFEVSCFELVIVIGENM